MQKKIGVHGVTYSKNKKRVILGQKERRRVIQLMLCIGLFLIVLTGKGIAPETWAESGERLLHVIQTDTDFEHLISSFGKVFEEKSMPLETEKGTKISVVEDREEVLQYIQNDEFAKDEIAEKFKKTPTAQSILEQLGMELNESDRGEEGASDSKDTLIPIEEIPIYTGPALPVGASMEYHELGLAEIVAPIRGEVTSTFGYREHPVGGEQSFHTGADIAAEIGTPVAAFAAGTVDFIGESEAYGLYIQLDHGNGVTTFYCHCHELFARKGEYVSAGQTIATVGSTGNATGPHLHIELERDGVFLNPLYYFEASV